MVNPTDLLLLIDPATVAMFCAALGTIILGAYKSTAIATLVAEAHTQRLLIFVLHLIE